MVAQSQTEYGQNALFAVNDREQRISFLRIMLFRFFNQQ